MSRNTPVTLTAAAVTLACVGASLYFSPPVIAQNMGREVATFAPLQRTTDLVATHEAPLTTVIDASQRDTSTISSVTVQEAEPIAVPEPMPEPVDEKVVVTSPQPTVEPSPAEPTVAPPTEAIPLPSVQVDLPAPETPTPEPTEPDVDLESPDSLTVIVNKHRPLPADYEPADLMDVGTGEHRLRAEAAEAALAMFDAAREDGIELTVISGYRSYDYQARLYDNYVAQYGVEHTNTVSAQPGYSEHQTGLALDVDTPGGTHTLRQSFGDTAAGTWVAEHAHEFGFIIRYPQDSAEVTGFNYEPWHLRYFGEQFSQHVIDNSGIAETAFELDPAPDYLTGP